MRASPSIIRFISILSALLIPTFAEKKSYVVYLGSHSRDSEIEVSAVEYERVRNSHFTLLGSFLGSEEKAQESIFYSYTRHINGFAAVLDEAEVDQISKHPDVISVFLNRPKKLHTTRSWEFMGLEHDGQIQPSWTEARFGEDAIIANLDTGVWPESKSFSDEGFGPIPPRWKGICQNGQDPTFKCNRKLIGARFFNKGYFAAVGGTVSSSIFDSPRDTEGHGSHTLSTAGGNFVPGASLFGLGNGTAKGGSPKARVVAYKVCGPMTFEGSCYDADILAGFDMAISDGVDVISVSLGGRPQPYEEDSIAIGSFHAVKHGIVVVCSAGNAGPDLATVSNVAPWLITVGASTMDRKLATFLNLGNNISLVGASYSDKRLPNNTFFPIVTAASVKATNASDSNATFCMAGCLDPIKAKGKIVVCLRGENGIVEKGINAASAGAVGMVLANDVSDGNEISSDAHVLPAVQIRYTDGAAVFAYINSTVNPTAYISPPSTLLGIKPAPVMAPFSSRGPNTVTPEIFKPDITAPGVDVIAAYSEAQGPTGESFDKRRTPYFVESGTSMSCPHVSGIAGLLKTLHPDWSPAAIRSAIMTSARTRDNAVERITDDGHIKATPFAYGAGHVHPSQAMDPGLIYDLTNQDYLTFLCSLGYNETNILLFTDETFTCPKPISLVNLNYPSIAVPKLNGSITVTRTVKNVGSSPATYTALVVNPPGLSVDVQPKTLAFATIGDQKSFNVTITATKAGANRDYVFGMLTWSDGKHYVRSQIAVKASD
ncbi:subtilisin-like protease SBT5.3 [Coffea arabica]|uniref:Subtilisin-like protease SBT5.3 n=1 Tax=Coffea arabica TaxID=13443 RepID=A0ABM4UIV5_COFAR